MTVVPNSLFISFMAVLTFSFTTTSSPMVGSSRYSILGLWIKEAAKSPLILCPRERVLTGLVMNSSKSKTLFKNFMFFSYTSSGIE